jgi:hypothetical protein
MRRPDISAAEASAFDELLASTPAAGEIAYDLPQPKWVFLHHLVTTGHLLHGSNEGAIEQFRTRDEVGEEHGRHLALLRGR